MEILELETLTFWEKDVTFKGESSIIKGNPSNVKAFLMNIRVKNFQFQMVTILWDIYREIQYKNLSFHKENRIYQYADIFCTCGHNFHVLKKDITFKGESSIIKGNLSSVKPKLSWWI